MEEEYDATLPATTSATLGVRNGQGIRGDGTISHVDGFAKIAQEEAAMATIVHTTKIG